MFVEVKPRTVFFLQTLYFTAFIATVEKIITYALGEHDSGSAQVWRTSNDFCSPGSGDHLIRTEILSKKDIGTVAMGTRRPALKSLGT